jgi:hypothetical protein
MRHSRTSLQTMRSKIEGICGRCCNRNQPTGARRRL